MLSERTVAVSDPLSGGRAAGGEQQPGRTQHKALCNGPEELPLCSANTPNGAQGSAIITGCYERYGWKYLCLGQGEGDAAMIKRYPYNL